MAGRRKIGIEDSSAWVFNRMADVYGARPAYPAELVDLLHALAPRSKATVLDLGAGIGHLALPLAERGCEVHAVEPAQAMLERLRQEVSARSLTSVHCLHATAEQLPVATDSIELALVADTMHFLDAALSGHELGRVLRPQGALAIITCELGDTPFMSDVVRIMEESAPRRPRATSKTIPQLAALAGVSLGDSVLLHDHTPVDHARLQQILRSISFIGPAMNAPRFAAFWRRIRALSTSPIWSRTFTVRSGRRAAATRS